MKRKVWALILATVFSFALVSACSPSSSIPPSSVVPDSPTPAGSTPASTEPDGEPVTLTFWMADESDALTAYYESACEKFTSQNPNVRIEITTLPTSIDDISIKLNAATLSGNYPDLQVIYLAFVPVRGELGEFADLTSYVAGWNNKEDVMESCFVAGQYQGKQLGIGFYPAPTLKVYRKDYFREAGLDPEAPPTTWAELETYAEELVVRDDSGQVTRAGYAFPFTNAQPFHLTLMRQTGNTVVDSINNTVNFMTDDNVAVYERVNRMSKQNIPYDWNDATSNPFTQGNAAICDLSVNALDDMVRANPELQDEIGIVPPLDTPVKRAFGGNRLFVIGEESKYKDEAWKFIEYMMSPEEIMRRAETVNVTIVRTSLEDEFVKLNPWMNEAIIQYAPYTEGALLVSWANVVNQYLNAAFQEAYTGEKSAKDALQNAYDSITAELEDLF